MNRASALSFRDSEFASNHSGLVFEASQAEATRASDRLIVDMDDDAPVETEFQGLSANPGEWIETVQLGAGRSRWNLAMGTTVVVAASALCLVGTPVKAENNRPTLKKFYSASFSGPQAKRGLREKEAVTKVAAIDEANDAIRHARVDALAFAASIPDGLPRCEVWTDHESEIVFEWKFRDGGHAVVSCEGDGVIGYTMRINGTFESGQDLDPPAGRFPADLKDYLLAFA